MNMNTLPETDETDETDGAWTTNYNPPVSAAARRDMLSTTIASCRYHAGVQSRRAARLVANLRWDEAGSEYSCAMSLLDDAAEAETELCKLLGLAAGPSVLERAVAY